LTSLPLFSYEIQPESAVRLAPLILLTLNAVAVAEAQNRPAPVLTVDSVALVQVKLLDGSELVGHVVAKEDSLVTLETATGLRAVIPIRTVAEWRPIRGRTVKGKFRRFDPNVSRLFFTATGRTLGAGEAYVANYFLFLPFVAVGFTDRIMAAAGVSLVPGAPTQLLYFAPKIGVVKSPKLNFAIGGIVAAVPDEGSIGAAYGVVTAGSEDNAFTALLGYPFGEGIDNPRPGLVLGVEARTSNSSKFLAEAWSVPDAEAVPILFGMRVFGERLAVDFGLVGIAGGDISGFPFIPWVDFVINFGGGVKGRVAPAAQHSALSLPAIWGRTRHSGN
jgi:hypothetical protein